MYFIQATKLKRNFKEFNYSLCTSVCIKYSSKNEPNLTTLLIMCVVNVQKTNRHTSLLKMYKRFTLFNPFFTNNVTRRKKN